ncbi:MAG: Sensor histidine kinase RcsC [Phycisphaerales bacterium]|nr:Sensor histidine kinase RcsC [Phycisphaerales bacterium]
MEITQRSLMKVAVRTALLYALAGAVWILCSDWVVDAIVTDRAALTRVQNYKGWFFVGVTTVLLYLVLRTQFRLWEREFLDRMQAVKDLRTSEARFRTLVEQASDGIFMVDGDGHCTDANAAGCQMFGYGRDEIIGLKPDVALADGDLDRLKREMRSLLEGRPSKTLWKLRRKDGSTFQGEVNARRLPDGRLLGVVRDVTERFELEEQLRHAQKMEAVGQLAGGVAHDFNNLLTVILGACEMALSNTGPTDPNRRLLMEVREGGQRAAALTRQLLAFSRRAVVEPRVMDLNLAVRDTEPLLRRLVGRDITLILDLDATIGPVRADPGQIGQVLMNLVANAKEATPAGGTIAISTRGVPSSDRDVLRRARQVALSVRDTGSGMTPEVRARMFEPFFTTKPVGKGTGLGLSMVFGIVEQAGGSIDVESEPGKGTTISILLPVVQEQLASAASPVDPAAAGANCRATVLVVEDEPMVRELAVESLRREVRTVLEASDGPQALRVVEAHGSEIDLVVTDVVMPEMTGRELAEQLHKRLPGLKVLFTSGYTDDAAIRDGVASANVAFIQKPYTPQALVKKVRDMLERREPKSGFSAA